MDWPGWVGIVTGIAGLGAGAFAWLRTQRKELLSEEEAYQKRKREEQEHEQAKLAMPFRLLYEQAETKHQQTLQELRSDIATGQAGFRQIQSEHAQSQVALARAEVRLQALEQDNAECAQQVADLKRAIGELREQITRMHRETGAQP